MNRGHRSRRKIFLLQEFLQTETEQRSTCMKESRAGRRTIPRKPSSVHEFVHKSNKAIQPLILSKEKGESIQLQLDQEVRRFLRF